MNLHQSNNIYYCISWIISVSFSAITLCESSSRCKPCLLYTSDAADERSSVDLGGRRIIKKKNREDTGSGPNNQRPRPIEMTYPQVDLYE